MFDAPNNPDANALYRSLQRDVRAAVDRCADGLTRQYVPSPATPDEPHLSLESLLRELVAGRDGDQSAQRVLMVIGDSARRGDAVGLFLVERMAARHAVLQLDDLMMHGSFGARALAQLSGSGNAAA